MSKYDAFLKHLEKFEDVGMCKCTFQEIENIINEKLPDSAYEYPAFWSNHDSHPLMRLVLDAGWRSQNLDLIAKQVEFVKIYSQVTNFEELKDFVLNKMKMEKDHNYQPVMIRALLQNNGKATKDQIIDELQKENPEFEKSYFNNSPVFGVLLKHRVASFDNDKQLYYLINYESYHPRQFLEGIQLCNKKIEEANEIRKKLTESNVWLWPV